ncbi:MAG: glutamate synthase subunit alpha, partial [Candidatus Omnitrophica bacterium]|nr:glutamate synthase subunit alpha [Candidatus Omnitrophota bacterium]
MKAQGLYDPRFEHDSCGVGFVCNVKGRKSNQIIRQGLEVLRRLSHRGATGADPKTGDGAGLLIQIPHDFFLKVCRGNKIDLPAEGEYGVGLVFLPRDEQERKFCKNVFARIIRDEKQILLGWRSVPVDGSNIGKTAQDTQPAMEHIFIAKDRRIKGQLDFERKLYCLRKKIENAVRLSDLKEKSVFYITNLSSRTISFKGLLMPEQLEDFFLDLKDESIKSALCLVHSRYSTNTFPTWDLSQPFRFLAHNGEINTLRGNVNWMRAREGLLESRLFGHDLKKILPVIMPGGSDSATIDNVFELLVLAGRSLPHAMMMLIPSAWEQDNLMDERLKDFYKYHACLTEPWDGPAAIAFTDGTRVAAVLDRNGLRPCRYIITKKDLCVMASEVGVLDIAPSDIFKSGRLEPGKMLFIDTQAGRIIEDKEIKEMMFSAKPYSRWMQKKMMGLEMLALPKVKTKEATPDILQQLKALGYTREDLKVILKPMTEK